MAGKNNALQKPVNLSPELENVVGKGPMTRAQVTSRYVSGPAAAKSMRELAVAESFFNSL